MSGSTNQREILKVGQLGTLSLQVVTWLRKRTKVKAKIRKAAMDVVETSIYIYICRQEDLF